MKEIYKDIKGFEGLYQVSNLGRVKSLKFGKERALRPIATTTGYYQTKLHKNGKYYNKSVHRLVADAFIDNPNNLPCVNHINGIKTDNRAENLEWITYKENNIHAIKNGLKKEFTGSKKIPIHCPELNINFESVNEAARYFGCANVAIYWILIGKMKHLYKKYTFIYI